MDVTYILSMHFSYVACMSCSMVVPFDKPQQFKYLQGHEQDMKSDVSEACPTNSYLAHTMQVNDNDAVVEMCIFAII